MFQRKSLVTAIIVLMAAVGILAGCHSATWEEGSTEITTSVVTFNGGRYEARDFGPFTPSGAVYFMDGTSGATVRVYGTGEEVSFDFSDASTSIAASAPRGFDEVEMKKGLFLPTPAPLRSRAFYPPNTPDRYHRNATLHLMQVISMNMRAADRSAALLIGLPYAEKYPEIFFNPEIFGREGDASSFGVVQSLVEGSRPTDGYPARSFFGIYHILETPFGTFFNKKATQMELQPDERGRLARALPPVPFRYELINKPIPLYRVEDPAGDPVAEIIAAHHESDRPAVHFTPDSWPVHRPDLERIEARAAAVRSR